MNGNKKFTNVYIEDGYLTVDDEESLSLFNALADNGTIWQVLSQLFNDYAHGINREEELNKKLDTIMEKQESLDSLKVMEETLNSLLNANKIMMKQITALPPSSQPNSVASSSNVIIEAKSAPVVVEKTIERKPAKSKKSGGLFAGFTKSYDKFKD